MNYPPFCIIGAGVVGTAVGKVLSGKGYSFTGVFSRSIESAVACQQYIGQGIASENPETILKESQVVFITVPDRNIENVCEKLASLRLFNEETLVIHTSGALSSEALSSARKYASSIFSIHPIQSFANVKEAVANLKGSFFGVEGKGSASADQRVKQIVKDLGGIEIRLKTEHKALYHAATAVASNYLVTLIDLACNLMEKAGVEKEMSFELLKPLIFGSLNNIEKIRIPMALTGPISRGDVSTIKDHLKEIEKFFPEVLPLYKKLGEYTVPIALAKGKISEDGAHAMEECLGQVTFKN